MRRYTEESEWVEIADDLATVGLCKETIERVGEIVFISLPEKGELVLRKEPIAVIESTKAAIDLYAPVSGTVVAVNQELQKNSDLLNKEPETRGWLYTIRLQSLEETSILLKEPPCKQ